MYAFKVLLSLVAAIISVEAWYKCGDKPFCNKIRYKEATNHFIIADNSVHTMPNELRALLINTESQQVANLRVVALANETFRIQVDEIENNRFRADAALNGEPTKAKATFTKSSTRISMQNGEVAASIDMNPFKISVIRNNEIIAIVNGKGKMEFVSEADDLAVAMDVQFPNTYRAYGIPEHGERLSLQNTQVGGREPYRLFNVDYCCYNLEETADPLYGAIPVLYAHGNERTVGMFWLNAAQTFVDVSNVRDNIETFIISESGIIDLFIFGGPTLQATVKQYSKLTGTAPLPQLFALGYHQSRYSYFTEQDLMGVMNELDAHNFPVDVLWLDIDYTDGYKYFTWNLTAFPDPLRMQKELDSYGRKLVVIIDPHVKVLKDYHIYNEALFNNWFVRNPDNSAFEGECWPGVSSYIDFLNPNASNWYASQYHYENFANSANNLWLWNDMNEPSVFNIDEQTMPGDLLHYGDRPHRDVHNMYGFLQTKGTFQGLLERDGKTRRPFILTRSHFAGSQRYTAMWTGDNVASWEHMRISIPMCLTQGLAGMSFCGADVGGFVGNPTEELFQRWYQLGAWLPFFRAHSAIDTNRREPYLYSDEIQERFRTAIRQRYAHLPLWYTLWFEHERNGDPVMRPLAYHYKSDLDIDNSFLIGRDVLIAPVLEEGATSINVYLPGRDELWYNTQTNLMYKSGFYQLDVNMDTVPVFYRGGSFVFRKDTPRQTTRAMANDPYTLYIFLNNNHEASSTLYLDDFESYDYRNKEYIYRNLTFTNEMITNEKIDEDANMLEEYVFDKTIIYRPPTMAPYTKAVIVSSERRFDAEVTEVIPGVMVVDNLNLPVNSDFKINFFN